jgi:hypothetical protein
MGLQVTLDNASILTAIADYVANQGINVTDKQLDISLVAGRGTKGFSATVDISDAVTVENINVPEVVAVTHEEEDVTNTAGNSLFEQNG